MNLYNLIENHWYKNKNFLLTILLLPISGIFLFISRIRYYLYKFNILKSHKLPVPVVIVGNISVGGVGKTPLTKMLAIELEQCGINVGIILRGYKSKVKKPSIITPSMSSDLTGDEALIYANSNLKVAIGSDRYLAGLKLLSKYPEIKLIISDDGLQHYKLQRDFEIAVIDGNRLFGNQFVLPMGPLRESVTRLKLVDAIVITQNTLLTKKLNNYQTKLYYQNIKFNKIYNPITKEVVNPE